MKAATIVPQPYLPYIREQSYHLALAHLIGKDGFEDYTAFYKEIGNHCADKFLILDNGLIEGDPRPIEELVEKALDIGADELVLPDVFENRMATLRAADAALDYMYSNGFNEDLRVMAVPQGHDFETFLSCAREMLSWGIDTLAIPKVVTKLGGRDGRLLALIELQDLLKDAGMDVHLLGCWESPLELKVIENHVRQGTIAPVRGVDSAIAYIYARAGLRMSEAERPKGAVDFSASDAEPSLLKYNIAMWQHECASLPPIGESEQVQKIW